MSFRFPQPTNEDDFELLCLRFLRELWNCPTLQVYGKRGERQFGIDLIDESGNPPLRAVQCKHHEPDKTIPPTEIQDEVKEVLKCELPVAEYFILTTARKTVHGQNAIIRINLDHKGAFKVFLWTWADIEERLSQMDDATQDRVLHGDSGRSGPAICRMLKGVVVEHLDLSLYGSSNAIDLQLELVKGFLERHELEVAESKLHEIETRAPEKLQEHHWYQIKVFRSKIYSDRWQWEKAGWELIDAKRFMPETERAQINEAIGLELAGEREKAHELATELRVRFPRTVRLFNCWIRTVPPNTPLATILEAASSSPKDDEESILAIALHAIVGKCLDEAIGFAVQATIVGGESPHAWFVLGQAKHALGYKSMHGRRKALLQEAEEHYTKATNLARSHKMPGFEAAIRLNRGRVRHLLGGRNADADFLAAVELARPEDGLRTQYASYLLDEGRYDDALRELAADPSERTMVHRFYEAVARCGRNIGQDRKLAVELFQQIIASEPAERWADAHIFLVQCAIDSKDYDSAKTAISDSKLRDIDPLVYHSLCGWLAQVQGDIESAKAAFQQALTMLEDETPREHLFFLAQALGAVGEDESALPLFLNIYNPGVFNLECRKLLGCAQRLRRHNVASRVCRELRESGETDPRIIQTEIEILQLYDPQEALRVAQEYLVNNPNNRVVALYQSSLALRLDRPDLVISQINRLPEPSELTPEGTGIVLMVLTETEQHVAALSYAYESLRVHFDSEFAHGQFVSNFLQLASHCSELRIGGVAHLGVAVCYREEYEESDRWLILEDSIDPELSRGEFGPDHTISRALTDRTVGEAIVVSDLSVQPRTITIRAACHKFIYRFRDCMNQFQVRFPGASAIQAVHVGSGDEFDPSPIIKGLEGQKRHVDTLDDQYRTKPMSLYTYAMLVGRDEFEAWGHLASKPDLGIRCRNVDMDDPGIALGQFQKFKTIVIDLIALYTLANLELLKVLRVPGRSFVVSQTTFEYLQHLVERAEERAKDGRTGGTMTLTTDGKLELVPIAPDQRNRYAAFLGNIRDVVRECCRILPCPQAAELNPEQRELISKVLRRYNLDSMLLARSPDTTYWTDDWVVSIVGRNDFQASRVWTQVVLFVLKDEGAITQQEFDQAVAKMVGWHYTSLLCNDATLIAAAEIAEWDNSRWPVPEAMKTLGSELANASDRLEVAASAICAVWQRDLPVQIRQSFLFSLLCGLGSLGLVRRLREMIPRKFVGRAYSAGEVSNYIEYWLNHPTGIVLP